MNSVMPKWYASCPLANADFLCPIPRILLEYRIGMVGRRKPQRVYAVGRATNGDSD